MPLIDTDRERAIERVRAKIKEIYYLRGTGPVSQEFFQWVDETMLVLEQAFGRGSAEVNALARAVGDRSPIYSQGIPPHGEWGLLARLKRAEDVLNAGLEVLAGPPEAPRRFPKTEIATQDPLTPVRVQPAPVVKIPEPPVAPAPAAPAPVPAVAAEAEPPRPRVYITGRDQPCPVVIARR